jgi:hypothetical protein
MALPSSNIAAAVRLKQKYIQQEIAKGRSQNNIRKELIEQGMGKVSRAYFNEIISDFGNDIASNTVPKAAVGATAVSASPPASVAEACATIEPRRGNFVDDRFNNDL